MFDPVIHALNGDDQIAIFVPPYEQRPVSWRPEGRTGIWLSIPDRLDVSVSISPAALEKAVAGGRLLLVEIDATDIHETWVPVAA